MSETAPHREQMETNDPFVREFEQARLEEATRAQTEALNIDRQESLANDELAMGQLVNPEPTSEPQPNNRTGNKSKAHGRAIAEESQRKKDQLLALQQSQRAQGKGFKGLTDAEADINKAPEFDKTAAEISALNDEAQIAIWGSQGRKIFDKNGKEITDKNHPLNKGILEIIRTTGAGSHKERQAKADKFEADIHKLMQEDGLELCQAKLVMDLRNRSEGEKAKMIAKLISGGMDPDAAIAKADERYAYVEKNRLALIKNKGVYTFHDYNLVRSGYDADPHDGSTAELPKAPETPEEKAAREQAEFIADAAQAREIARKALEAPEDRMLLYELGLATEELAAVMASREKGVLNLKTDEKLQAAQSRYEEARKAVHAKMFDALKAAGLSDESITREMIRMNDGIDETQAGLRDNKGEAGMLGEVTAGYATGRFGSKKEQGKLGKVLGKLGQNNAGQQALFNDPTRTAPLGKDLAIPHNGNLTPAQKQERAEARRAMLESKFLTWWGTNKGKKGALLKAGVVGVPAAAVGALTAPIWIGAAGGVTGLAAAGLIAKRIGMTYARGRMDNQANALLNAENHAAYRVQNQRDRLAENRAQNVGVYTGENSVSDSFVEDNQRIVGWNRRRARNAVIVGAVAGTAAGLAVDLIQGGIDNPFDRNGGSGGAPENPNGGSGGGDTPGGNGSPGETPNDGGNGGTTIDDGPKGPDGNGGDNGSDNPNPNTGRDLSPDVPAGLTVDAGDGFEDSLQEQYGLSDAQAREAYLAIREHVQGQPGTYMEGSDVRISNAGTFNLNPAAQAALQKYLQENNLV